MDWKPIESAPRTGKAILARRGNCWAIIEWSLVAQEWVDYWDGEPNPAFPPRHWQPLP